jgi:hypothetical protein
MAMIYGLRDPTDTDQTIYYVGCTKRKSLARRLVAHLIEPSLVRKAKTGKNIWISQLLDNNIMPEIVLLENVSVSQLLVRERYWINFYREANKRAGKPFLNSLHDHLSGRRQITNGKRNGTLKPGQTMPDGFRYGSGFSAEFLERAAKNCSVLGKKARDTIMINNGAVTKRIQKGQAVPDGWRRGMSPEAWITRRQKYGQSGFSRRV